MVEGFQLGQILLYLLLQHFLILASIHHVHSMLINNIASQACATLISPFSFFDYEFQEQSYWTFILVRLFSLDLALANYSSILSIITTSLTLIVVFLYKHY